MSDPTYQNPPSQGAVARTLPGDRRLLWLLLAWSLAVRLLFAWIDPGPDRFWDERYSLQNIRHILENGTLEPVSGWYPVPSYLPHTALLATSRWIHDETGVEAFEVLVGPKFTATAYRICRSLQAIVGTLTVLLTFLLGRRVFDSRTALLGALILAATPNHIRMSGFFKPDILTLLLGLITVLLSIRAIRRPGLGTYLAVGLSIALAASAKLTGVLYALPLVVGTLAASWRSTRRWLWLTAAGVGSAVSFFLLNPHWRLYLDYFGRLQAQYGEKAAAISTSHVDVFVDSIRSLLSPGYHGPWLGIAALVGLAALPFTGTRHPENTPENTKRTERSMLVSFPLLYLVVYAAMTTYPKSNHYLQVVPYTSLGAAWLLAWLWRRMSVTLQRPLPRAVPIACATAFAMALVAPATGYVYRAAVPSTTAVLAETLRARLKPISLRTIYRERSTPEIEVRDYRDHALVVTVDDLSELPVDELDLADAVVLGADGPKPPAGAMLDARLTAASPENVLQVEASLLVTRGPNLLAIVQPWELSETIALPLRQRRDGDSLDLIARLPDSVDMATPISVGLWLSRLDTTPGLDVGATRLQMHSTRDGTRRDRYLSRRFFAPPTARLRFRLPPDRELSERPIVEIFLWRPPATPVPSGDRPDDP